MCDNCDFSARSIKYMNFHINKQKYLTQLDGIIFIDPTLVEQHKEGGSGLPTFVHSPMGWGE